jgi:hypothetical protein
MEVQMTRFALAALPLILVAGTALADSPTWPTDSAHGSATRITAALNILEAAGYGDFRDFHADGRNFAASVTQQGQTFPVVIDPESGQVTRAG